MIQGVQHTSIHLPPWGAGLKGDFTEQAMFVKSVVDRHVAVMTVAHPDLMTPELYEALVAAGVPVAIENMDTAKKSGYRIKELRGLVDQFGLSYVLDVQHAWEHDYDMGYAGELLAEFGNELRYLHMSGQLGDNIHALVHLAENREAILGFVAEVLGTHSVPIILEGEYKTPNEVKTEIDFLWKELT